MNSEIEIIRLQESQIKQASETLINAFAINQLNQRDESEQEDFVSWANSPLIVFDSEVPDSYWQSVLRYCQSLKHVYTTPEIKGIAAWIPQGWYPLDFWRCLETGYYWGIFKSYPFSWLTDTYYIQNMRQPYWYLFALGVLPDYQRQGIGSSLIQPILKRASEDGLPCYLEARTEEAVSFYQKNGFEIIEKFETPTFEQTITYWTMKREPTN